MYTEMIKIIEGGLRGDKEKVLNYSKLLVKILNQNGEARLAEKINAIIDSNKPGFITLDSLSTKPVDTESRLEMVDIEYIIEGSLSPVLGKHVESSVENFINQYLKRDLILQKGISLDSTLLLYGPPGCGKSTLARYIAMKTQLPLVTVRLDGLISSLLGSTAKNIRKIFDYAAKKECILFLDEFDVIAKIRDDKNDLGELKRVVNSLLQNIDEFSENSILIAATNHHQMLDSAVWRRFSTIVLLDLPKRDEIEIFVVKLLSNIGNDITASKLKLDSIVNTLIGNSFSAIETIVHNSIKKVIINNKTSISSLDILQETYLYLYHSVDNEDNFVKYLLDNGVTQKELNEELGFSSRNG